jgi:hypothetical protein
VSTHIITESLGKADYKDDLGAKDIISRGLMDLLPNEQNLDLDNSRQKFHHSLKEHHKISNIPKFRCEML